MLQVRVLGAFEVAVSGRVADLGGPKPRTLLALLVAGEGQPVTIQHLVDQLWGDDPPDRAEATLQTYVARLRRALEPTRQVRARAAVLRTHPGAYSLHSQQVMVDAQLFRDQVHTARDARARDPEAAGRLLARALACWGGEPYPGLTAGSRTLEAEASRLRELWASAQEELWELRVDRGEHAAAVAELGHLVDQQPFRERLWGLLALAQYRSARQGEALETLRKARAHLAEELGIDPGEELRRLEAAMLRQDPSLDTPVRPPGRPPSDLGRRQTREDPEAAASPAPLVGRDHPLAAAREVLGRCRHGRGRVVLVSGEAGIGKTRFADSVVAEAKALGFRTGSGSWDPDGAPPLWGWRRAVAQALGRDDVLDPPPGAVLDAVSQTYRLADALVDAIPGDRPTLLVLDDAHWADDDSLRLLRRVATDLGDVPLVLLLTVRAAVGETTGSVSAALAALARLNPARIELAGLDTRGVQDYVRTYTGTDVSGPVAAELSRRTGGNPFFVGELVRLLAAEEALEELDSPAWRKVPQGVRDVVRRRLSPDPAAARVLAIAAVVGRSFELRLLHEVHNGAGPVAEVDDAVESALDLGMIEADGPGRYRFVHALVRDAVYETMPAPSRTRAHADVAAALEHQHAGHLSEMAAELAEHYRLAGPAHARSAWTFARAAGEAAASGSLHHEAHRLLAMAEALQRLDPVVGPEEREQLWVALGRALRRLSRPLDAWEPLAAAGASALGRGDAGAAAAALLEIVVGAVWGWRIRAQVDTNAIALWEATLQALDGADVDAPAGQVLRAKVEAAIAVELLYRPGSAAHATALADSAIARCRSVSAAPEDLGAVLQLCGMALARPQLVERRARLTDEMVTLATRSADDNRLAVALVGRASARAELGQLDDARSDMVRARELAERHHLRQIVVVAGWGEAVYQLAHGRFDAMRAEVAELQQLNESLAIPGAGVDQFLLATAELLQDRLGELEPPLRMAARLHPTAVRDMHALALVAAGRRVEARELLGPWREQPELLEDYLWTTLSVLRAWLWLELADDDAIADLRRQLAPYAGQMAAGSMSSSFLGSVSHTLGRLAVAAGDREQGKAHLLAALRDYERLALQPWIERTNTALEALAAR